VAYAAGSVLLGLRRPRRGLVCLAPYAVAVAVASVQTSSDLEALADRFKVPLAFVAMHVGWGLGFWSGLRSRLIGT
jgi:hypothetical protein